MIYNNNYIYIYIYIYITFLGIKRGSTVTLGLTSEGDSDCLCNSNALGVANILGVVYMV